MDGTGCSCSYAGTLAALVSVGGCTYLLFCTCCAEWACASPKTSRSVIKHVLLLVIYVLAALVGSRPAPKDLMLSDEA